MSLDTKIYYFHIESSFVTKKFYNIGPWRSRCSGPRGWSTWTIRRLFPECQQQSRN